MKTFFRFLICVVILAIMSFSAEADAQFQPRSINGYVYDENNEPLPGANITVLNPSDSSFVRGTTSGADGSFIVRPLRPASYFLSVSFVGYGRYFSEIDLTEQSIDELVIRLKEGSLELDDIRITAMAERMEVRGDTVAFNADAYRVNPDANAEDLVRRMPGFTMQDGRVQSQGEDVRRVLVDGSEFFGDDATAALRNLPAEIIQQIEVFDRLTDQAQFTGFNDGNTELTLNIRTRPGMNHGRFGRASTSYGTQERYMGGGNANFFNGPQRLSVIGLTNNMNQQNFSMEDLAGVAQAPSRGGRGGRGGMMMSGRGGWGGGGSARDFLVGQQNGINTVHSFGMNYTDRWNDSWNVTGSYFFNATDNSNEQSTVRRYLTGFEANQIYDENSFSTSDNYNHRFNARMEYTIDERNSLIITPRMSFQQNNSMQNLNGLTLQQDLQPVNETSNFYRSENFSYDISNTLLYRRNFEQRGRTVSLNIRTDFNDRDGNQLQDGQTVFYDETNRDLINNQNTEINSGGYTLSANLQYTEPLSERSQLIFGYNPSFNRSSSVRDAFQYDSNTDSYSIPDPQLTNRFDNNVTQHRAQTGYRFNQEQYNANFTLAYQHTLLDGEQTYPFAAQSRKMYNNLLPSAMFMYRFSRSSNLRLMYNTNTRTPSAQQLQDVVDVSNPLQLSSGNPDLNQQYSHNISLRYRSANAEKGTSFMSFISAGYTTDYIGNTTFVASADTLIRDGVLMGRGARFTTPENTGNAWNVRSFLNVGLPVTAIRSNMNIFSGVTYSQNPVRVNDETSNSSNIGLNGGLTLSSNISPNTDFLISYRAGYNIVDNSLNPELDNNYYNGRARASMNVIAWERLVIASDVNINHYVGLSDEFNLDTIYWNASLGYKFLHNRAAEFRVTVVDVLGQNNSVNRIIEDNYIEDVRSDVLSRYLMFTFSYNFRVFSGQGR